MNLETSIKVQGYLVGYSILENGNIINETKFDVPVKNTIVTAGKTWLMTRNTTDNSFTVDGWTPMFGWSSGLARAGALTFCAKGSSNTATTADMTGLVSIVGTYTQTILSGDPNTGTRYDKENGKIIMRVTHDHAVETSDQNINELGWFSYLYSVRRMFSRIVLPNTVTVQTGQQLRTTYQLEISVAPTTLTPFSFTMTGLGTVTGNYMLQAKIPETTTTFGSVANSLMSCIDTNGNHLGVSAPNYYCGLTFTPDAYRTTDNYGGYNQYDMILYTATQAFTTYGDYTTTTNPAASSSVLITNTSSGSCTITPSVYVAGSNYRDITYVLDPNFPNGTDVTFSAIRVRGLLFVFDSPITKLNTQRLTFNLRTTIA